MRNGASAGETAADALIFDDPQPMRQPSGWEIVPTYEAKCLVAYLMSLDQSHPLEGSESAAAAPRFIARSVTGAGKEMNENPSTPKRVAPGNGLRRDGGGAGTHAAIQREKREPRVGCEPLSLWLIALYGSPSFSAAPISDVTPEISAATDSIR